MKLPTTKELLFFSTLWQSLDILPHSLTLGATLPSKEYHFESWTCKNELKLEQNWTSVWKSPLASSSSPLAQRTSTFFDALAVLLLLLAFSIPLAYLSYIRFCFTKWLMQKRRIFFSHSSTYTALLVVKIGCDIPLVKTKRPHMCAQCIFMCPISM